MALRMLSLASSSVKPIFPSSIFGHVWKMLHGPKISVRTLYTNIISNIVTPSAKYGGRHTVAMIPGDGVGPELMLHVQTVFRHACVPVDFEVVQVTSVSSEEEVHNAIQAVRRNRICLKGNIEMDHNLPLDHQSRNNMLRATLDLYANVIHFKNLPSIKTRHENVDIIVVRENTEGEYSNLEHEGVKGVVESLKIITKAKSLRIAEHAFKLAQKLRRQKVTVVHKANIMKLGDGLFLQCCEEVATRYPQLFLESMVVDNATMQLVSHPQQFDVMLMPNLYGNIINNICTGLVGGAGVVPGANYGSTCAVFETASRQSGKNVANRNLANPTAMLLTSCNMLDYLTLHHHATCIRNAILRSIENKAIHTPDIGGKGSTLDIIHSITKKIPHIG
ncbi:isocitrate dehydrogenase [NAD] subunit gamma, mitochondrial-like [Perognathus longimembris pacificus]|uniref:isocitrate dehydrogenase [NAD] subunit gamma, mitochondrial-like n=1 Tax=Perognathus longimembris pacificus TaxID=214514 RepID=UPI0020186185|nr:isocitrate dehydrogenase [NAD] subunit gamma, mitochondrial-like [Perognathus longimembris pacificus]